MAGKPTSTHVLLTLGALFTIGGATRLLPHAFAAAENSATETALAAPSQAKATPVAYEPDTPGDEDRICLTGETATALAEDQKLIAARADSLREKELAVQLREKELAAQAVELQALQKELEERWSQMSTEANQDLEHLANMYGAMKPDQAAGIFNQMDPAFAAGFLRLMPSDRAGLILAGMDTSKAYVVSVNLASKNRDIRQATQEQ